MGKNLEKVIEDINMIRKFEAGGFVIRNNGKTILLSNGKYLWKRPNHAKAALANHFETIYSYEQLKEWGFQGGTELSNYVQNSGILKIEPI